jgi:copper chaperone CopZ
MTHTYNITGMTCSDCASKVQKLLSSVAGVEMVNINLEKSKADISMQHHIQTSALQNALKDYPKYQLTEQANHHAQIANKEETKTWLETYKILISIFKAIFIRKKDCCK